MNTPARCSRRYSRLFLTRDYLTGQRSLRHIHGGLFIYSPREYLSHGGMKMFTEIFTGGNAGVQMFQASRRPPNLDARPTHSAARVSTGPLDEIGRGTLATKAVGRVVDISCDRPKGRKT